MPFYYRQKPQDNSIDHRIRSPRREPYNVVNLTKEKFRKWREAADVQRTRFLVVSSILWYLRTGDKYVPGMVMMCFLTVCIQQGSWYIDTGNGATNSYVALAGCRLRVGWCFRYLKGKYLNEHWRANLQADAGLFLFKILHRFHNPLRTSSHIALKWTLRYEAGKFFSSYFAIYWYIIIILLVSPSSSH
jgi:hypothetical protein